MLRGRQGASIRLTCWALLTQEKRISEKRSEKQKNAPYACYWRVIWAKCSYRKSNQKDRNLQVVAQKISGVDIFAWITGIFTVVLWTRLVEISYGSSAGRFTIRLNMRKRLVASSIPLIDISVTGTQQ